MNTRFSPSLTASGPYHFKDKAFVPRTLLDLLYDGFYALFLLKNHNNPEGQEAFANNVTYFLQEFEHNAQQLGETAEAIQAAKYAYCAAVDEVVLRSDFSIRAQWESHPLQLTLFGDQLAGENFFLELDKLRQQGAKYLQALEVFHMCLLLGFEGKYLLEGREKLNYLTARLGDEIALIKGKSAGFAPHWARPDNFMHRLRRDVPVWLIGGMFTTLALAGYGIFAWNLSQATETSLSPYHQLVQLPPATANITITLP
ncbi:MAG: type VI secretion system protein ImpK [Methylobacter sp.]|nr:MAG: type VI secretion system protein ImpK [Methylobacter sp.]PPD28934.1 MAG: type VI secretion system protein ImpK [Methylomonas sp.]